MKLFFPDNLFSRLIFDSLPDKFIKNNISFHSSSLLAKQLNINPSSAALIPTMDLINNKDLFVSEKIGLSFEGSLCNSYIYFAAGEKNIKELSLTGDISSLEVVLSKILFKEIYDSDVELKLKTNDNLQNNTAGIIVGDQNFFNDKFKSGLSFAEEISEMISLPFVNYILVSKDENLIKELNNALNKIETTVYENIEEGMLSLNLSGEAQNYITQNASSIIVNFDPNDIEGINQLIRLPYFHGIIDNILDIKFV
jgi:hypothetical protein